jgi:hypothetical protein
MIKRGNKRAIEHVEVIISFALFFSFIVFLAWILIPTQKDTINSAVVNIISEKIIENTSVGVNVTVLITRDKGIAGGCFNVSENDIVLPSNAVVRDYKGNVKNISKDANYLYVNESVNEQIYYLYESSIFPAVITTTIPLGCAHTSLVGSISNDNYIFEGNLESLNKSYYLNYTSLKESLNIPQNNDFSFTIMDNSRNELISASKNIPQIANVISKDIPIEVIKNDSSTYLGFLNVKVW